MASVNIGNRPGARWLDSCKLLKYKGLCMVVLRDPPHRRYNDTLLALRDAGLYPVVCVLVCVLNSDHAPWGECRWFQMGREAIDSYMKSADYNTDPIFMDLLPMVLRDLNLEHRVGEPNLNKEVWDQLPEAWGKIQEQECRDGLPL